MKKFIKYTLVISMAVISVFLAIYNCLCSSEINSLIYGMTDVMPTLNWHVFICIFSCLLAFIAVINMVISFLPHENDVLSKYAQLILFVLSLIMFTICLIFYLVTLFRTYESLNNLEELSKLETTNQIYSMLYINPLLLLTLNCIPLIILSVIAIKSFEEKETIKNTNENNNLDENILLKNEINKIKKELEINELKEEYKTLYMKLQNSKQSNTDKDKNQVSGNTQN